jgi:hypothetical protein
MVRLPGRDICEAAASCNALCGAFCARLGVGRLQIGAKVNRDLPRSGGKLNRFNFFQ